MPAKEGEEMPIVATTIAAVGAFGKVGNFLGKLFGGDPRKLRDTEKVQQFNDEWLFPISRALQAREVTPDQACELLPKFEEANRATIASYERPQSATNFSHQEGFRGTRRALQQKCAQVRGARARASLGEKLRGALPVLGIALALVVGFIVASR